jgi:hypothetical protein
MDSAELTAELHQPAKLLPHVQPVFLSPFSGPGTHSIPVTNVFPAGTGMMLANVARDACADVKPNSLAPTAFLAPSPPSLLVYANQFFMATALTSLWLTEGIPALWRRTSTRPWSDLLLPLIAKDKSGRQCPEVLAPWQVVGQAGYERCLLSHVPSNVRVVRCCAQPGVVLHPQDLKPCCRFDKGSANVHADVLRVPSAV